MFQEPTVLKDILFIIREWKEKVGSQEITVITSMFGLGVPGERNGNPLQYYCLENPMDRGAW